ncbi:MAG: secondary thiamine-phosphate synthase enzyme YjbQ [Paludisphaera borealis]|uniref:secondary thiamine-phosphate synthase enzyme YjbQ n=1 Tax=Paludisphaera borealis TaxID=1387353 RepID=UPI002842E758|nr:secondary thiamine-phosphate synthase enzyme YjbQ [Paludisphaera borealis]MDR3621528.1 secondary thiamine-phosphate synthase enzyme YjbQ [Paludisphaera borealis]
MIHQKTLALQTRGRGTVEITGEVERIVSASGVRTGLCNVFIRHTSASLIVCENADPSVREDLERFAARLAPDGDPLFGHTLEGPDDMPAHIRAILTQAALTIPVIQGSLALGTWQGVFLWEHRTHPHRRSMLVTVMGED